jgi:uncharacterized membrane protein
MRGKTPGTMNLFRLRHELRTAIWLVPILCLFASLALAIVTLAIDRAGDFKLIGQSVLGSPAAVQQILSTAASSLLSLATVVLSLTLVAVQLAMGQFSPRIVRALLEDRRSQLAIGLFIGTFAYTMAVLRDVDDQSGQMPGLSVLVSYLLIMASVAGLVVFVHYAGQSIRVSGLIDLVGDTTRRELERLYPRRSAEAHERNEPDVIASPDSGNVIGLDESGLVALARDEDCMLELIPAMGDFVAGGEPLLRVHGTMEQRDEAAALVLLDGERTHQDDPSYGVRKLVDIAARGVASSPFDDPTTTVQALHRIRDCLRLLAAREFPTGRHHDPSGALRLMTPVLTWEGYVRLGFDELRLVGAASPQVARALRAALEDIRTVAPPSRQPPLDRQLELLSAAVQRKFDDGSDSQAAMLPDGLGIGGGADLIEREPPVVSAEPPVVSAERDRIRGREPTRADG